MVSCKTTCGSTITVSATHGFNVAGESRVHGVCGSSEDPSVPTIVDDEELGMQTMEAVVLGKIRPSRSVPGLELLVFGFCLGCKNVNVVEFFGHGRAMIVQRLNPRDHGNVTPFGS